MVKINQAPTSECIGIDYSTNKTTPVSCETGKPLFPQPKAPVPLTPQKKPKPTRTQPPPSDSGPCIRYDENTNKSTPIPCPTKPHIFNQQNTSSNQQMNVQGPKSNVLQSSQQTPRVNNNNIQAAPTALGTINKSSKESIIKLYSDFVRQNPKTDKFIRTKCIEYGNHFGYVISPELVYAHIYSESSFKPKSAENPRSGDYGLMQITDNLAEQMNKKLVRIAPTKKNPHPQNTTDATWDKIHHKKNLKDNLEMGIVNIGENLRNTHGDILKSIENYNGGARRIRENENKFALYNDAKNQEYLQRIQTYKDNVWQVYCLYSKTPRPQ